MITIGIDPDMIASGIAVVNGKKVLHLLSIKLPDLIRTIKAIGAPAEVCIKLEDPEANKGLFASRKNENKAVSVAIAMSVGKVQATTHHIKELLESEGYAVKMVRPLKGEVKRRAKADDKYFNNLTGWTGRSNQDKRDAALIALFG
jgi:hypothetical protein